MSSSVTPDLIAELQSLLPSVHLVTPDSEDYQASIDRWLTLGILPAGLISYPTTSAHVSVLLSFASRHSLEVAVKSGGHGLRAVSSTDGGIVIDLAKFKTLSISNAEGNEGVKVTIGAGCLWSEIYTFLGARSLGIVGGVCTGVGVGGFSLVGGYGWLTGSRGLAIDNIASVQIVLADGSIKSSSEQENEDLFWAIRGAGPCFGVVTEFVMRAYPQPNLVWNGEMVLGREALRTVLEVGDRIMEEGNGDGRAAMDFTWGIPPESPTGEIQIMALVFYDGPEVAAKEFFAPLLDLKPDMNTTKMKPFAEAGVPGVSRLGKWRKVIAGGSLMAPFDVKFFEELWDEFEKFVKDVPDADVSILAWEILNPSAMLRKGQRETAFANRGRMVNIMIVPTWKSEENDGVVREWGKGMRDKVQKELERRKADERVDETTREGAGEYGNYDGFGRTGKDMFGVNYDRLVELKRKYDSKNMFNKLADLTRHEQETEKRLLSEES